ncbi:hypothetical protein BDK51DRAFT_28241 [Blyttiomyces helicus]|uniref:Uncharacterized protein n=1 Tax=Blyttiomyces helicus TaxID=388810 RepID=A0A4P9WFN4_9FUNG|nr:hypothetical protein BDK51DRAFT_28241 [Blyttiomyces helicus]|eukprot:RKO90675.1 hypothetical protein BDK51DRAFT_28241 [Blyttiomyces helicus]
MPFNDFEESSPHYAARLSRLHVLAGDNSVWRDTFLQRFDPPATGHKPLVKMYKEGARGLRKVASGKDGWQNLLPPHSKLLDEDGGYQMKVFGSGREMVDAVRLGG